MNCPINVVSNAQIAFKQLFFRLDQPMRYDCACASAGPASGFLWELELLTAAAVTLPINDWLFHLEGRTIPPYCTLLFLPFISIGVNRLCISKVFAKTQSLNTKNAQHCNTKVCSL